MVITNIIPAAHSFIVSMNAIQLHKSTVIKRSDLIHLAMAAFENQFVPVCLHCLSASCLVCLRVQAVQSLSNLRLVFLACLQARICSLFSCLLALLGSLQNKENASVCAYVHFGAKTKNNNQLHSLVT